MGMANGKKLLGFIKFVLIPPFKESDSDSILFEIIGSLLIAWLGFWLWGFVFESLIIKIVLAICLLWPLYLTIEFAILFVGETILFGCYQWIKTKLKK